MNNSHKTAITRKKPSVPTTFLMSRNLITGRVLDYGCGKGFDCSFFKFECYDPYYAPNMPEGKFDTIICNYVLNVVPEWDQEEILNKVSELLNPDGIAYFSVRRDKFTLGRNKRGSYQRLVYLNSNFKSIRKTTSYEIYEMRKNEKTM